MTGMLPNSCPILVLIKSTEDLAITMHTNVGQSLAQTWIKLNRRKIHNGYYLWRNYDNSMFLVRMLLKRCKYDTVCRKAICQRWTGVPDI